MKNSEKTRKLIERMDLFKEDAYKTFANRPKETRANTYKIVEEVEKIGLSGVVINPNYENNTCAVYFKHGTMGKMIEKCILPIFKDYNLEVEYQLKLLDLVEKSKNNQYSVSYLKSKLNDFLRRVMKNNKNNIKPMLKEVDYVFSGIASRKLVALENKQKREERKRIKTNNPNK